ADLIRAEVILLATAILSDVGGAPRSVRVVLAVPGAWLLATQTGLDPTLWIRLTVGIGTIVVGELMADFGSRHRRDGYALPLVALTALGIYFTVPDTERAAV